MLSGLGGHQGGNEVQQRLRSVSRRGGGAELSGGDEGLVAVQRVTLLQSKPPTGLQVFQSKRACKSGPVFATPHELSWLSGCQALAPGSQSSSLLAQLLPPTTA